MRALRGMPARRLELRNGFAWPQRVTLRFAIAGFVTACGNDVGPPGGWMAIEAPMPRDARISLVAGHAKELVVPLALPDTFSLGTFTHASIDAVDSLSAMAITRTDGGTSPSPSVTIDLRVVPGHAASCEGGIHGPRVVIIGDSNGTFATKYPNLEHLELANDILDALSGPAFTLCVRATASADVLVELGYLVGRLELDAGCDTPPSRIAGTYEGTQLCHDTCNAHDGPAAIAMQVFQQGETAMYVDDRDAVYVGSVCGGSFRYLGGTTGFWGWGELVIEGATATRQSGWTSTDDDHCGGVCSDDLDRY